MVDIVERLRDWENDPMWANHAEVPKITLKAAADEIERLRADNKELNVAATNAIGSKLESIREAVAEERERCAKVAEETCFACGGTGHGGCSHVAAAIRGQHG